MEPRCRQFGRKRGNVLGKNPRCGVYSENYFLVTSDFRVNARNIDISISQKRRLHLCRAVAAERRFDKVARAGRGRGRERGVGRGGLLAGGAENVEPSEVTSRRREGKGGALTRTSAGEALHREKSTLRGGDGGGDGCA